MFLYEDIKVDVIVVSDTYTAKKLLTCKKNKLG